MSKKKDKDAKVVVEEVNEQAEITESDAVDTTPVVATKTDAAGTLGTNRALTIALIAVVAVASMVIGGLLTFIFVTSDNSNQEAYEYAEEYISEEERQLNELEALLQQLLAGNEVADLPFITGAEARTIALDYVGHGTAEGDLLFFSDGVPTYEVDIRHDGTRYMVYVNSEGSVVDSSNFVDDAEEE
ncbi:MAG: PepSY domain-containing protein [Coriobacteriia bacterium]|nr:PepSY domain-containing protein [Coriobacteriia bacterium]